MSTGSTAVTFIFMFIVIYTTVESQDSPLKICLKDEDRTRTLNVTLSCPLGTVIAVGEAFFGRNQWGLCSYTDNDCIKDITSFQSCDGHRNCVRGFNGTYTRECGYSTFLTVIYDCVGGVVQTPPPRLESVPLPPQEKETWTPYSADPRLEEVHVASWDPVVTPKSRDDTALIAGCAVAVVVTVTVLIIAILLVIRRLFGAQQGSNTSPKKPAISVLICTKLGCAMASCRESDPEEGGSQSELPVEEEGRVTPLGADAVEVVQELGRPDVTSDIQAETNIDIVRSVQGQESVTGSSSTQSSVASASRSSSASTSQTRLDAVALPNTELSTLC